ncbi:MAG: hypothetical protein AAF573_10205 [Bacteroidota bacterium]
MNNEHPKWNFQEFSAFLMLYAAHADLEMTEDEKAAILQKVDQATFDVINEEYVQLSDKEKIDLILSYKGVHFPTAERTNELLNVLKEEFLADGKYSLLERNLMMIMKKLM